MRHPDENTIESFLLAPDPGNERHEAVREHLGACPACRQVADFIRRINAELSAEMPEPSERVLEFIQSISSPPNVIKLKKFEGSRGEQVHGDEPIILAAHSPERKLRFRPVATLVSADESILLRIVYDDHDSVYRVSFQRASPSHSPILVHIPSWDVTCMIDAAGETELHLAIDPERLPQPDAEVRLPAAEVDVRIAHQPDRIQVTPVSGEVNGIRCTAVGQELLVAQDESTESPRYRNLVVSGSTFAPQLFNLKPSSVRIILPENASSLRLSLFA